VQMSESKCDLVVALIYHSAAWDRSNQGATAGSGMRCVQPVTRTARCRLMGGSPQSGRPRRLERFGGDLGGCRQAGRQAGR